MECTEIDVNKIFDDHDILRFCRARKFKLMEVQTMLQAHFNWRKEKGIDDYLDNYFQEGEDPNNELALFRKNTCFHGVDKAGRPVYIERLCNEEVVAMVETGEADRIMKFFISNCELSNRLLFPVCSLMAGKRIETT